MKKEAELARDRANIRTDMWGSREWRRLSTGAQWLYMYLLTSPTLSYVGIADWRPGRIAAKVGDAREADVIERVAELTAGRFVFVDDDTEEALVRSFLRHDGLLVNPNLWRSIGNDFAEASSEPLRGIIADEARRLREENPDGFTTAKGGVVNPWQSKYLSTLLDTPSGTPSWEVAATGSPATTATSSKEETPAANAASASASSTPHMKPADVERLFDEAYAAWPKKVERKKSFDKFKQLVKRHDPAVLGADIKRFGEAYARTTERQFVPALVVWLNGERWTDELPGSASSRPQRENLRDAPAPWMEGGDDE